MTGDRMNNAPDEKLEARLSEAGRAFIYPTIPDIAGSVAGRLTRRGGRGSRLLRRGLVAALVLLLIGLCLMLAVPEVRAAILNLLRIGNVIIFPVAPTATPTQQVATAAPTPTLLPSLRNLAGEMPLNNARQYVPFPIRLPPDFGPPDKVYYQYYGGPMLILVWLDPAKADGIALSLHLLGSGAFAFKVEPTIIQETTVRGQPALWTVGPYLVILQRGNRAGPEMHRLVRGNVLVWTEGEVTYRLESDLPLAEAVRIAESLE